MAATGPTKPTLTHILVSGSELSSLPDLLGTDKSVVSAWNLSATEHYTSDDAAYPSLFAGSGSAAFFCLYQCRFNQTSKQNRGSLDIRFILRYV
jgi:hypothetical protein